MKNKKKVALLLTVTSTSLLCASALVLVSKNLAGSINAQEVGSEMLFDRNALVVEKDMGYLHQTSLKNNQIDLIGYESVVGKFGKIKQITHTDGLDSTKHITYKGMIYNRSIINGFESLEVNYEGSQLFVKFTEYLMEDMNFDEAEEEKIVSGSKVFVPSGKYYFVLYTSGETTIESFDIKYTCDGSADASMMYGSKATLGNARSISSNVNQVDSYVELTNKSTWEYNNYSTGTYSGNSRSWYRWNGQEFGKSDNLGTSFEIHMTILGNLSQALDKHEAIEDNWFSYGVWPELSKNNIDPLNTNWMMSYMGNDNYEPLGKDSPDRVHSDDDHGLYSYSGRFFTRFCIWDEANHKWIEEFNDPDTTYTLENGSTTTLREAYETYPLPYWHLVFKVVNNDYWIYNNGFLIEEDCFNGTFNPASDSWSVYRMPMHSVNFGQIAEDPNVVGRHNGAAAYDGMFTIPRVVKL